MKKKISVLCLVILCLNITACSGNNELVGTWEGQSSGNTLIFTKDTCTVVDYGFSGNHEYTYSYEVEDGTICVENEEGETEISSYKLEGDSLLMNGECYYKK